MQFKIAIVLIFLLSACSSGNGSIFGGSRVGPESKQSIENRNNAIKSVGESLKGWGQTPKSRESSSTDFQIPKRDKTGQSCRRDYDCGYNQFGEQLRCHKPKRNNNPFVDGVCIDD